MKKECVSVCVEHGGKENRTMSSHVGPPFLFSLFPILEVVGGPRKRINSMEFQKARLCGTIYSMKRLHLKTLVFF